MPVPGSPPPVASPPTAYLILIEVNGKAVEIDAISATGSAIKSAAIAQSVRIEQNFVLQQELPNGSSAIVGDNDVVQLSEHMRFTAIAPDDNS